MTANEVMAEEMLAAGEKPEYVALLMKMSKYEILDGSAEVSGEEEYRLRIYVRRMLAMSAAEFKEHFETHQHEIEIAKIIVQEKN